LAKRWTRLRTTFKLHGTHEWGSRGNQTPDSPPHQDAFDVLRGHAVFVEPLQDAVEDEGLGIIKPGLRRGSRIGENHECRDGGDKWTFTFIASFKFKRRPCRTSVQEFLGFGMRLEIQPWT
jgi:hypothetical protein